MMMNILQNKNAKITKILKKKSICMKSTCIVIFKGITHVLEDLCPQFLYNFCSWSKQCDRRESDTYEEENKKIMMFYDISVSRIKFDPYCTQKNMIHKFVFMWGACIAGALINQTIFS